jgi:DNA-binding XRE family transcriptional regulator
MLGSDVDAMPTDDLQGRLNRMPDRSIGKGNRKGHDDVRHAKDFDWRGLGDRIRRWRLARGMNQQQLADVCGMTQSGLYRVETGQTNPQLATLQRIAWALHCSVRELFCVSPSSNCISPALSSG